MTHTVIMLPFPPTLNGLYAGKARRYKSPRYKAWLDEAWFQINPQRPLAHFDTPVSIIIHLGRPDNRKRDVANYEKATTDFLVAANVLKDDALIHSNTQRWNDDVNGCMVEIEG